MLRTWVSLNNKQRPVAAGFPLPQPNVDLEAWLRGRRLWRRPRAPPLHTGSKPRAKAQCFFLAFFFAFFFAAFFFFLAAMGFS